MIYLCDLNMKVLEGELNVPVVYSTNPPNHSSRTVHRNETSRLSGIHNPHEEIMTGTFFELKNNVIGMRKVKATNNKKAMLQ